MSNVATHLDDLRIAIGETEALAAVTMDSYDRQDWGESDPATVDRISCLLGLVSKSAIAALAAFHRLHGAIADATPAPAGEVWDYGTPPRAEPAGAASAGNELAVSARDTEIVRRLRERCAAKFARPIGYPFFLASYLDGEDPDAALLRLFRRNQQVLGRTDDDVIAAMIPFALAHEKPQTMATDDPIHPLPAVDGRAPSVIAAPRSNDRA